jgi:hypothetical protein
MWGIISLKIFVADATKGGVRGSKSQMFSKSFISWVAAIASLAAILAFCGLEAPAQSTAQPATSLVDEVYLAKDDGHGKAGEQVTEFTQSDIPIHCVVLLESAGKATVKMTFVAVAVPGVKPDTKVVSASYTTGENQDRVNFTGRPDGKWTPGRYRVDIFVDGKQGKQLEFNIKQGPPALRSITTFVPPSTPKPQTEQ